MINSGKYEVEPLSIPCWCGNRRWMTHAILNGWYFWTITCAHCDAVDTDVDEPFAD